MNIVHATFGSIREAITRAIHQYDYGQVLRFVGITLPPTYEVHFSNSKTGTARTAIGDENGVTIPEYYTQSGADIYAWVYLHTGQNDGETVYTVRIPVKPRAQPSDEAPTPVEQSAITQAIAALNGAVEASSGYASAAQQAAASVTSDASSAAASASSAASSATDAIDAATAAHSDAQGVAEDAANVRAVEGRLTALSAHVDEQAAAVQSMIDGLTVADDNEY